MIIDDHVDHCDEHLTDRKTETKLFFLMNINGQCDDDCDKPSTDSSNHDFNDIDSNILMIIAI